MYFKLQEAFVWGKFLGQVFGASFWELFLATVFGNYFLGKVFEKQIVEKTMCLNCLQTLHFRMNHVSRATFLKILFQTDLK